GALGGESGQGAGPARPGPDPRRVVGRARGRLGGQPRDRALLRPGPGTPLGRLLAPGGERGPVAPNPSLHRTPGGDLGTDLTALRSSILSRSRAARASAVRMPLSWRATSNDSRTDG